MAFQRTDHNETRVLQIGKPDDNEVWREERGERTKFPIGRLHLQVVIFLLYLENTILIKRKKGSFPHLGHLWPPARDEVEVDKGVGLLEGALEENLIFLAPKILWLSQLCQQLFNGALFRPKRNVFIFVNIDFGYGLARIEQLVHVHHDFFLCWIFANPRKFFLHRKSSKNVFVEENQREIGWIG